MNMRLVALRACVTKELLLLGRDVHGLALLFLMPLAFVLIMSIALQGQFAEMAGVHLKAIVVDADNSPASRALLQSLRQDGGFDVLTPAISADAAVLDRRLLSDKAAFALTIPAGFASRLLEGTGTDLPRLLGIGVAPDTSKQTEALFIGTIRAALARERTVAMLTALGGAGIADTLPTTARADELHVHYAYSSDSDSGIRPTAVQQSVPAWLVFGAFFIMVPLSNTFIRERQQGTLRRLRSTNLGSLTLLTGKLIPYFAVNQLQVLLMLLAGRFLVPLLGGDALQIRGAWWLLAVMSVSLSLAALGLALLVAVTSRTTEQATLLSGTGNIILAALGGIMVPKFVMPATMQQVAAYSPMSWGLEGFLDILLRGGGFREIAPRMAGLTALGIASILIAWLVQSAKED